MARTLLYTVQRVLEKLDLDSVNSINDSQDAQLIAREAEDTFYDMSSRDEWPDQIDILKIESVGDTSNPTALRLPTNTSKIASVRYDVIDADEEEPTIKEMEEVTNEEFLDRNFNRQESDEDITTVNYKGIDLYMWHHQAPTYFTSFDNELLIFDSWYRDVEDTMVGEKSIVRGVTLPTFEVEDDYEIPLEVTMYPLYLAELSAACSISLNGVQAPEEERRKNRGISRLRRTATRTAGVSLRRNKYGREDSGRR